MKIIRSCFFLFFITPVLSMANPGIKRIKNFNFDYVDPNGFGVADSFSREGAPSGRAEVSIEKKNKDFFFFVKGSEDYQFELNDAPTFMTTAETMNVSGLNLSLENNVRVNISSADFRSSKNEMKLENFNLTCSKFSAKMDWIENLLIGCVSSMNLNSEYFNSSKVNKFLQHILREFKNKENFDPSSLFDVNDARISINNGQLKVYGQIKSDISGKIRGKGHFFYHESQKTLELRIDEVRFGILNITQRIFNEIKEANIPNIEVRQPYVYWRRSSI